MYTEIEKLIKEKKIVDGNTGAYRFPLFCQKFMIDWCCSQTDDRIKPLKARNFESADIDVLNYHADMICRMIDELDIHPEIKECQKRRVHHRLAVGLRKKRKELIEIVDAIQHNLSLPIEKNGSEAERKFSQESDCVYNNKENILTNVDLQFFYELMIQDYKSLIEKHNYIFKRMIEGRKWQLRKMAFDDLASTSYPLKALSWSVVLKNQHDEELAINGETMEQLIQKCEGQIDGYEKRLTSKYNELNNLMLEIAAFNHSEDGEEKTGRQLYGHLFFLEDEIDTIEVELSACKSKKIQ